MAVSRQKIRDNAKSAARSVGLGELTSADLDAMVVRVQSIEPHPFVFFIAKLTNTRSLFRVAIPNGSRWANAVYHRERKLIVDFYTDQQVERIVGEDWKKLMQPIGSHLDETSKDDVWPPPVDEVIE